MPYPIFIDAGHAHIRSTFNNTIVTITDVQGNTIAWSSSGGQGFKGSRKNTPYAAQTAAEAAAKGAMEHGMKTVEVYVKGPGNGREAAIRALQTTGLNITLIKENGLWKIIGMQQTAILMEAEETGDEAVKK